MPQLQKVPIGTIARACTLHYAACVRRAIVPLALVTLATLHIACQSTRMTTEDNKAFIKEMLDTKKELTDYPDRFDTGITMHEPQMLPFGGNYQGIEAFQKFYPAVRRYYDFSTWELLGVY